MMQHETDFEWFRATHQISEEKKSNILYEVNDYTGCSAFELYHFPTFQSHLLLFSQATFSKQLGEFKKINLAHYTIKFYSYLISIKRKKMFLFTLKNINVR